MDKIVFSTPSEIIDPQAQMVVNFLNRVGLPSDNIIADQSERNKIGSNLYSLLESLPVESKREARYLSKFVVGAGIGLFDYALNAIWNEVVLDLRKKAIMYGIDIFFDAAVGGSKNRDFYQSENDLPSLKDAHLLDASRKLELISDTTYKKLKHILEMRNDVGISHPTNYSINAFELLGWLEVCINDVLNDQPTESSIRVQQFINNLKSNKSQLSDQNVQTLQGNISQLPTHLSASILRTIFGIFVSHDTDVVVQKNISLIAPHVWASCKDDARYKLGVLLEGYNNNLDIEKHKKGVSFFETVGGNAYRSASEKVVILSELITELYEKHTGWDNFYNEAPIAAKIYSYIPEQQYIFDNLAERLFKVILTCRIGRDVSFCDGVSPRGKEYYEKILSLSGDKFGRYVLYALNDQIVSYKLSSAACKRKAKEALICAKANIINERLAECFDFAITHIESSPGFLNSKEYTQLMGSL